MKTKMVVLAAAGMLAASAPWAASAADVLKAKGCLNCHQMDKKKVGPAFKDVAAKYQGKASAKEELVTKLKSGKGHMKIKATDAELEDAVGQVLDAK
jgi:cytochrome c